MYLYHHLEVSGITTVGFITASSGRVSGVLTVAQLSVGNNTVDNLIGYAFTTFITDNADGSVDQKLVSILQQVLEHLTTVLTVTGDVEVTGLTTTGTLSVDADSNGKNI